MNPAHPVFAVVSAAPRFVCGTDAKSAVERIDTARAAFWEIRQKTAGLSEVDR